MIFISQLLLNIEKKLFPKFKNKILCTQYSWWLVEAITNKKEIVLISEQEISWTQSDQKKLDEYLDNLINKDMPLQYVLGSTPFTSLTIICKPPILIPRPETEEWCSNLIEELTPLRNQSLWILDLCSGSGCIALALAKAFPKATVYGTDISDAAHALAQENAAHNHISNVTFLVSDLFAQIPQEFTFDIIVANPPYIPPQDWPTLEKSVSEWEDKKALIAEDNGCIILKKIIDQAPLYLKKNEAMKMLNIPQLIMEIDSTQGNTIGNYMKQQGYSHIKIQKDLEQKDRVAQGRVANVAVAQDTP